MNTPARKIDQLADRYLSILPAGKVRYYTAYAITALVATVVLFVIVPFAFKAIFFAVGLAMKIVGIVLVILVMVGAWYGYNLYVTRGLRWPPKK